MISPKLLLGALLILGSVTTTYGMEEADGLITLTVDERSDAQGFYMLISTRADCQALKTSFLASPYVRHVDTTATALPAWHTEDQDHKLLNFFFGHLAGRYCGQYLFGPKRAEITPLLKCFLVSPCAKKVNLNVPGDRTYLITEAAKNEDAELVKLLSDAGASIHARAPEERNQTAYETAREHGVAQNLQSKKQKESHFSLQ